VTRNRTSLEVFILGFVLGAATAVIGITVLFVFSFGPLSTKGHRLPKGTSGQR
jgi:hypothetical protein